MDLILSCPLCRSRLTESGGSATCGACGSSFPRIGPILDLRAPGVSWIDYDRDRSRAKSLLELGPHVRVEALLEAVFEGRPGWSEEQTKYRTRTFLDALSVLEADLRGWIAPLHSGGIVLDLGCGGGQLVAVLARHGQRVVGVDVSLEWLVVAHRLCGAHQENVRLIAALAESLPFADATFSAVASLDVLEHVGNQQVYLREIDRVLSPGGAAVLSTPNRYSAAAEPHVGVWGVGWLPRKWQKPYAERRSGLSYDFVRLLGYHEIRRLFRRNTHMALEIRVAPIGSSAMGSMRGRRALLARAYNALLTMPGVRTLFLLIGPFFQIVGHKSAPLAGRP